MSHSKYTLHIPLNVLHVQPLQYPIYSFFFLHTTSLKYNTVLHLIEMVIVPLFCWKGNVHSVPDRLYGKYQLDYTENKGGS